MWYVFTVYDAKAENYGDLYLARRKSVGGRMFSDAVTGGRDNALNQHPEDFSLVCVGTFDEQSGLLEAQPIEVVLTAEQVLASVPPSPQLELGSGH